MNKVRNIIREARGNMSQTEFARMLGKSQGLISKYEKGSVSPPADTLDRCMTILQKNNQKDEISTEILITRIRKELKEPHLGHIRKTIATLLDGIPQ